MSYLNQTGLALSPDGATLGYATYLGGSSQQDEARGIVVDGNGHAYRRVGVGQQCGRLCGRCLGVGAEGRALSDGGSGALRFPGDVALAGSEGRPSAYEGLWFRASARAAQGAVAVRCRCTPNAARPTMPAL